tara:strand:+ start:2538 stop:3965 length:1428 start_codon:yes stop_codon:yes gene_type:complete
MRFIAFLLILFTSCAEEEFATKRNLNSINVPLTFSSTVENCSNYTLIRPYVDFLFLWDNTSSQVFVSDATKSALRQTINLISDRFDYHIMMAPLVKTNPENNFLITRNKLGLNSSALDIRVEESEAEESLDSFTTALSSEEHGIQRAVDIISQNRSNGIFRKNSYVVIVLMSNGNDQFFTSSGFFDGPTTSNYLQTKLTELSNISTERESIKTRFISLVGHQPCNNGWKEGSTYRQFSSLVHENNYNCSADQSNDYECLSQTPDSHDICQMNFSSLFDAVNNSITDTVVKHKYDHWPISMQESPLLFNESTIQVFKSSGEELLEVSGEEPSESGWKYIGYKENHATTYEPFVGENQSAHMIQLYGNARVTYPECLLVSYESPTYYYGYGYLDSKPLEGSIRVKKNGTLVSEDEWTYIGFKESQNLRILGPGNPSEPFLEGFPADTVNNKYIIKFSESFIYQSGDIVEITADPKGT